MMTQRKLQTPREKVRRSLHIVRSMSWLERFWAAVWRVTVQVVGTLFLVVLTVAAFVPWSLCWVWSGACP